MRWYDVKSLAKYITMKCYADGHPITPAELQQVLYIVQEAFVLNGSIAFLEPIIAVNIGPQVQSIHLMYCSSYGVRRIFPVGYFQNVRDFKFPDQAFVNEVVDTAIQYDFFTMKNLLCSETEAWHRVWCNERGVSAVIPLKYIAGAKQPVWECIRKK